MRIVGSGLVIAAYFITLHLDVVTGVIGKHKFAYDLWGAAVNFASRMESTSEPGKIHISESLHKLIKEDFRFIKRKGLKVKGVGNIDSYFVE